MQVSYMTDDDKAQLQLISYPRNLNLFTEGSRFLCQRFTIEVQTSKVKDTYTIKGRRSFDLHSNTVA